MSRRQNDLAGTASANRARPADPLAARMSGATLIAVLLHAGLAVYAYHHPMPLGPRKTGPITVDVVVHRPPPRLCRKNRRNHCLCRRRCPSQLRCSRSVRRRSRKSFSRCSDRKTARRAARRYRFRYSRRCHPAKPDRLACPRPARAVSQIARQVVGGPIAGAPIPKGPDRLFKDERLEEKA